MIALLLLACISETTTPETIPDTDQPTDTGEAQDTGEVLDTGSPAPERIEPPNLLLNPGFEDGDGELPDHWAAYGDGTYTWTSDRSVQLGGAPFAMLYQRVTASPGERYSASVTAESLSGTASATLKLEFHDASDRKISEHTWPLSAPAGSTRFALTATAPENTSQATASIVGSGDILTTFDDASLQATIPELTFDLDDTEQVFDGFGAQIWGYAADLDALSAALTGLNIQLVRIENVWESATDAQLQQTAQATEALGVGWVYMTWAEPGGYATGGMLSDPEGFASWWATTVADLDALGIRPGHIELMNEPDSGGAWSTGIAPETWRTLVTSTRAALDGAGYADVQIVGPGTAAFNWGHGARDMILALDDAAVASVGVWSAHAWDDDGSCDDSAACLTRAFRDFADAARQQDPGGERPLWVTEYATKATTFGGADWPAPDAAGTFNATWSTGYAVRLYVNTLALLNAGASVPFLWQLLDEPTEVYEKNKGWGLVGLDGQPKPAYDALQPLCAALPVGGRVLTPPDQADLGAYAAAVATDDQIVVGLANSGDAEAEVIVRLRDNRGPLSVRSATMFVETDPGDPGAERAGTATVSDASIVLSQGEGVWSFPVSLPAQSTLTVSLERR